MGVLKVVSEALAKNIRTFTLEGQIGQLKGRVARMRDMQTSQVWPDIDSVPEFSANYRDAIANGESRLRRRKSALALEDQDAAAAAALRQLVGRIGSDVSSHETSKAASPDLGTYS